MGKKLKLYYDKYTVKELIDVLQALSKELPDGEDTYVCLGDSECNYTYKKINPCIDTESNSICLMYELHEKGANTIQNMIDSGEMDDILDMWKKLP